MATPQGEAMYRESSADGMTLRVAALKGEGNDLRISLARGGVPMGTLELVADEARELKKILGTFVY